MTMDVLSLERAGNAVVLPSLQEVNRHACPY